MPMQKVMPEKCLIHGNKSDLYLVGEDVLYAQYTVQHLS